MTFNPNIPGPNDIISQSQAQIQTNFSQADSIFDVNHVTFDDSSAADRGKHRRSTYIEVTDPVTAANEIAVYAKDVSGSTRMFLRQENNGTVIQTSGNNPIISSNGETYLPGFAGQPLGCKWGQFTTTGTTTVMTYTSMVPALTAFTFGTLMVQLTPINSGGVGDYRISTQNATSFTVVAPSGASFFFFVIGY